MSLTQRHAQLLWTIGLYAACLFVGALAGYVFIEVVARGMGL